MNSYLKKWLTNINYFNWSNLLNFKFYVEMIQSEEPIQLEEFRDGITKLVQKLNSFNLNGNNLKNGMNIIRNEWNILKF